MTITIENKVNGRGINVAGRIPFDETMVCALLEGKTINEFKPYGRVFIELKRI